MTFLFDRLGLYVAGAVIAALGALNVWQAVISGPRQYRAGIAFQLAEEARRIAEKNDVIERMNNAVAEQFDAHDAELAAARETAERIEIVEIPVEVRARCDLPAASRAALNDIR